MLLGSFLAFGQPVNDEPCNAIALSVSNSCNFTQFTNASATASAGIPAPGCASYTDADVWFTVVVPASGNLILDGLEGTITDGGMAVYTASSCSGPFALNDCDDDNSANGLMPYLNLTGLVPGSTIYVRFWEYGGDNNGTFSICAWDATAPPPPPSNACLSPVPDLCSSACDLGSLPTPPPCVTGTPISQGSVATFNLSNIGATAGNPYSQIGSCAAPSADVWYRFTATGTQLQLAINSDPNNPLNTPNVSLYNGNNCNALLPLVCYTGTGGNLTQQTYAPVTPGDVYYLQIAGADPNDQGLFTLLIKNNYDCDNCLLTDNLTVTPAPTNGTYPPGTTVNFCYTVSNYNQTAANWLHGIDLNFGGGWDLSTLTAVSTPSSCATTAGASWGFYQSVTGSVTGTTYGPGFFYETSSGNANGATDGNPGNNFGDQGVGTTCPVTFCWSIATNPSGLCVNGTSLVVNINTLGDYESGSWTSIGCQSDPVANFISSLSCCNPPVMAATTTSCGLNNGTASATANGFGPWAYSWANSSGTIISSSTAVNGGDTLSNLASGQYFVTVTDATGCTSTGNVLVQASSGGNATASNTGPYCEGSTISLNVVPAGVSYTWSGPNSFSSTLQSPVINGATVAMGGTYNVTVTYSGGCSATASTTVSVSSNTGNPVTLQADQTVCPGSSVTLSPSGSPYVSYAWSSGQTTATISVTTPGDYWVTVNNGICSLVSDTFTLSNFTLPQPAAHSDTTVCNGQSAQLTADAGYTNYQWSNGQNGASITVNTAGSYTYTATDANSCTVVSTAAVVTTGNAPNPVITATLPVICTGQNTSTLNAGSEAGVTYTWSPTGNIGDTIIVSSPGTYTVTADLNGCTATASYTVADAAPQLQLPPSVSSCCTAVNLNVYAEGLTYVWSNGSTDSAIVISTTNNTAMNYGVTVTDVNGCSATAQTEVFVKCIDAVATAIPDSVLLNDSTTLTVTTGYVGPFHYQWTPSASLSNGAIQNPLASPADVTTYTVIVTDTSISGCVDTAEVTVFVVFPAAVIMPNVFSPNGDGRNDTYFPVIGGPSQEVLEFRIYNRWGQMIHNSNTPWDGDFNSKAQPGGTYTYYLVMRVPDEANIGQTKNVKLQGSVTLVR